MTEEIHEPTEGEQPKPAIDVDSIRVANAAIEDFMAERGEYALQPAPEARCYCGNIESHIAHNEDSFAFNHPFQGETK